MEKNCRDRAGTASCCETCINQIGVGGANNTLQMAPTMLCCPRWRMDCRRAICREASQTRWHVHIQKLCLLTLVPHSPQDIELCDLKNTTVPYLSLLSQYSVSACGGRGGTIDVGSRDAKISPATKQPFRQTDRRDPRAWAIKCLADKTGSGTIAASNSLAVRRSSWPTVMLGGGGGIPLHSHCCCCCCCCCGRNVGKWLLLPEEEEECFGGAAGYTICSRAACILIFTKWWWWLWGGGW